MVPLIQYQKDFGTEILLKNGKKQDTFSIVSILVLEYQDYSILPNTLILRFWLMMCFLLKYAKNHVTLVSSN